MKALLKIEDIIFANRTEAEDTLDKMREIGRDYGTVRVVDLCDLVGLRSSHLLNNFAWQPNWLTNTDILRVRDGWVLDLPTAELIESVPSKVTYRSYSPQKPKPTPKTLTIAIDYAGVDDDFDDVLAKAVRHAQTITDREVQIDIC